MPARAVGPYAPDVSVGESVGGGLGGVGVSNRLAVRGPGGVLGELVVGLVVGKTPLSRGVGGHEPEVRVAGEDVTAGGPGGVGFGGEGGLHQVEAFGRAVEGVDFHLGVVPSRCAGDRAIVDPYADLQGRVHGLGPALGV